MKMMKCLGKIIRKVKIMIKFKKDRVKKMHQRQPGNNPRKELKRKKLRNVRVKRERRPRKRRREGLLQQRKK